MGVHFGANSSCKLIPQFLTIHKCPNSLRNWPYLKGKLPEFWRGQLPHPMPAPTSYFYDHKLSKEGQVAYIKLIVVFLKESNRRIWRVAQKGEVATPEINFFHLKSCFSCVWDSLAQFCQLDTVIKNIFFLTSPPITIECVWELSITSISASLTVIIHIYEIN